MKKTNSVNVPVPPYDGFEDEVMNAGWLSPLAEENLQRDKSPRLGNASSMLSENDSDNFLARVYANQE